MMRALAIALSLALAAPAAGEPWPAEMTDPAAAAGAPADLVLPMPCGATMAFQKVAVPVEAADPLADRRITLGQSQDRTGYSDYLRTAFLRGPFAEPGSQTTHFYIARYELTAGQWRALGGDCAAPERVDRQAKGGLSWFDAVDFARRYTQWLYVNAPDALPDTLPDTGGVRAFLRLPTEDEWEFAARGGARIDATGFSGLMFFAQGDLRDYALFQAPGSGRGRLGPVGLRQPNSLGLFDIYGNAEELMLDPYRLNALGRLHGQAGGIVTRGGSVLSTADQIYSAQRTEYPPFDGAGAPLAAETFGLRLVISAPAAGSDAQVDAIRRRWSELAAAAPTDGGAADPDLLLSGLIAAEPDPRRQAALAGLQLEIRRARDRTQTARLQSARSTLLSGAMFVGALIENAQAIDAKAANIRMLVALQRAGSGSALLDRQVQGHARQIEAMRDAGAAYLLSYQAALDALVNETTPEERRAAQAVLREELTLSGQSRSRDLLDRFWSDLGRYVDNPGMGPEELRQLARD